MNPFDPLASAHDAVWSLFARGPVGLAAQFFIDPQTTVASPAREAQPQAVIHEPASHYSDTSNAQLRTAASSPKRLGPETGRPQWLSSPFEHGQGTPHFKVYGSSGSNSHPPPTIRLVPRAPQDPA